MKIDLINAEVAFDFIAVDTATIDAFDPDTEEGTTPVIPNKLVAPAPPVLTSVTAAIFNDAANARVKDISATFADPARSDLTYQIQYRISGSSGAFTQSSKQSGAAPSGGFVTAKFLTAIDFLDTNNWEVQVRAYAPTGAPSAFSASATALH